MRLTISWSVFDCPGGSIAFHFHCIQRAELVKVPSFSQNPEAGKRYTSVGMSLASGVWYWSLGAFQKAAVSISTLSTTTIHFSLERAPIILSELGPMATGFIPKVMKPSGPASSPPARLDLPRYMSSKMYIHE